MNKNDLEALRALEADASELERIQSLSNRFNVFETIGFVNQELMHSRFLAFLLDPRQNHGLNDAFLRRLLDEASPSLDLRDVDLGQTLVHREWQHVDILLTNEAHRFAVIIENKIWTNEHSDQLVRYYQQVKKRHPGWQVLGIYLTPQGDAPSKIEDKEKYLSLSYGAVCEILEDLLEVWGSALSADVRVSIEHYVQMVGRSIVGDSEVTRLCQQMYQKHNRALDLIYEHRFAHKEVIRGVLTRLINETPGLTYNTRFTHYPRGEWISFRVQGWEIPILKGAKGAFQDCILLFVFASLPNRLYLFLSLGPGDEETRNGLFRMALSNRTTFNDIAELLKVETKIFSRPILPPEFYTDASDEERKQEIRRQWNEFIEEDLPRIQAALKEEAWIWDTAEADE